MKKILSLFVATFLLLTTVGVPTFANSNKNIIIRNDINATGVKIKDDAQSVVKSFEAYKVLNLTLSSDGKIYNYSVNEGFKNFFRAEAPNASEVDTDSKLDAFAINYIKTKNIDEVATKLRKYIIDNNITKSGVSTNYTNVNDIETVTIPNLELGYYIVVDKTQSDKTVIAAAALGSTDTDLTVNLKASKPTIDKKIYHNELNSWEIVGDNQIGQKVDFRLIGTLPTNVNGYTSYEYTIHDKLSEGLTFNNDVEVYVGEKDKGGRVLANQYYDKNIAPVDGHTFGISIKVLDGLRDKVFNTGEKIYVYYSATLNEKAKIAGDSNENLAYIEYSNNPYDNTKKEKTPDRIVRDYTFKINALKTSEDNITPLKGAEFSISRDSMDVRFKLLTKDGENIYTICTEVNHESETGEGKCTNKIVSGENGKFQIIGLDDAIDYTLTETKAPENYRPISPVTFRITAEYETEGINIGKIKNISTNVDGIKREGQSFELGTLIVNTSAVILPGTGGIGTTLFSVAGGGLMLSAVALLIYKKRKKVS